MQLEWVLEPLDVISEKGCRSFSCTPMFLKKSRLREANFLYVRFLRPLNKLFNGVGHIVHLIIALIY